MTSSNNKNWLILIAIGLFTFMSTLDSSIVNMALPTLSKELQITSSQATWVVSIYLIIISGLLLFFGRLGDMISKIRVFQIGTFVFTTGSLLAGINLGFYFLLITRLIQAIGAAMTMSNSFGITTQVFPPEQRARAMSLIGIFVSIGGLTGPGLGGLILQFLPWSYIFWINVPVGIIAIYLGFRFFPKAQTRPLGKIDWLGSFILFIAVAALFLGLNAGQEIGFTKPIVLLLLIVAILLLPLFILVENRQDNPLVNFSIFKSSLFTISIISGFMVFVTTFFMTIILPFYYQDLRHLSPGPAGLLLMTFPILSAIVGPIAGILGDKFNKELITVVGLVLIIVGLISFSFVGSRVPIIQVVISTAIVAVGSGIFQSPNNALVMQDVPKSFLGIAGSFNALARNLGMITSNTFATVTLFSVISMQLGKPVTTFPMQSPETFIAGMHTVFVVASILTIFTLILTSYRLFRK